MIKSVVSVSGGCAIIDRSNGVCYHFYNLVAVAAITFAKRLCREGEI
jgi:hypothetical protein